MTSWRPCGCTKAIQGAQQKIHWNHVCIAAILRSVEGEGCQWGDFASMAAARSLFFPKNSAAKDNVICVDGQNSKGYIRMYQTWGIRGTYMIWLHHITPTPHPPWLEEGLVLFSSTLTHCYYLLLPMFQGNELQCYDGNIWVGHWTRQQPPDWAPSPRSTWRNPHNKKQNYDSIRVPQTCLVSHFCLWAIGITLGSDWV